MRQSVVTPEVAKVVAGLQQHPTVKKMMDYIEQDAARTQKEQKELVLVEAPTFHEEARGKVFAEYLKANGLVDVEIDEDGNVFGFIRGTGKGPTVLIEGHMDTVFSFGDTTEVIEKDGLLHAPGICDDTRGLAAVLSVARSILENNIELIGDVMVGGTVAEEGLGGLSGMRKLLLRYPFITSCVSLDGAGHDGITFEATGMRNYSVTYTGPGGHAYGKFGTPNPNSAVGRAVTLINDMDVPTDPKTTYAVSFIEGGHQIHSIAQRANFKINMRSVSALELDKLTERFIHCCHEGARLENERWGQPGVVKVELERILDVPAGTQDKDAPIVQLAWEVTKAMGATPELNFGGCTNASQAVDLKIPGICIGGGGEAGGVHSLQEWYDPTDDHIGVQRAAFIVLALAGVKGIVEPLIK